MKNLTRYQKNLKILVTNTKVERSTKQIVSIVRLNKEKNEKEMSEKFKKIEECTSDCLKLFDCDEFEKFNDLEKIIEKNQILLNEIGAGHDSIDEICKISQKYGLKSKLTGAGGGGCVITLLNNEDEKINDRFIQDIKNSGFECFESNLGGNGLILSSL